MKRFLSGLLLLSLATLLPVSTLSSTVSAVSGSEWRAGRIIDDTVFTNANDMSVGDIQAFLNARVPVCDTWGTKSSEFGGGTRAQYASSKGYSTPFTCLKDYYEVPKTAPSSAEPASNYGGAPIPPGAQSAAQIIANAAIKHNISPKTLLVKLATESPGPLTSDDWPFKKQYLYAMGAHCPDSGPDGSANCDANWSGFSLQMDEAASLLRWYLDSMTQPWWQYKKPYQVNHILWNVVERGCGGSNVYVESKATAALYTYTPYQPNQAALNNMYGTGDGCSAYGNRNFWRVWYDWFGTPLGPDYQASFFKQSEYQNLTSGSSKTIYFMFKNTGRLPWGDDVSAAGYNPVRLATDSPINRSSVFADSSWLSSNRTSGTFSAVYEADGTTLASDQHVVNPGQVVKMSFTISATQDITPGFYPEHFILMREGASDWAIQGSSAWTGVTVSPTHIASYHAQSDYPSLKTNEKTNSWVAYRNAGNVAWYDDQSVPPGQHPVHLATANELNRKSMFGNSWPSSNRPSGMFAAVYEGDGVTLAADQHVVNPGQIAKFEFTLTVPIFVSSGNYREYLQPILEGSSRWDMGGDVWLNVSVTNATRTAAYHSQSNYPVIKKGNSAPIHFLLKNSGQTKWYDDRSARPGVYPTHLASTSPINRNSVFSTPSQWLSSNRPNGMFTAVYEGDGVTLAADQHVVNPGQIAKFEFTLTVPTGTSNGFYQEYFQPIFEGGPNSTWNMGGKVWIGVTVES